MICLYVVEKRRYTSSTFNFQLMITCMTYFKNSIRSSFFIIELCESKEGSPTPFMPQSGQSLHWADHVIQNRNSFDPRSLFLSIPFSQIIKNTEKQPKRRNKTELRQCINHLKATAMTQLNYRMTPSQKLPRIVQPDRT